MNDDDQQTPAADEQQTPPPAGKPSWNLHPRVYLDVLKTGEVACPYCGTRYVFKGEAPKGH